MIKNFVIILLVTLSIASCKKDFFVEGGDGKLSFSNDSIIFDTIFTSIGSITKTLKIYNNNDTPTKINEIKLVNNNNLSVYRVNVDGSPIENNDEITIASNDSIFLFIEVTINPSIGSLLPFLISDSIKVSTKSTTNFIKLVAYGQNAHYHLATPQEDIFILNQNNDTIIPSFYSIKETTTWNNDLPHLVYGYVIIEKDAELIIEAGTKIYFHNNSGIIAGNPLFLDNIGGKLTVNGELNNEVIFQGDRLDEYYKDAPGQWDRIWLSPGSFDNSINYAIIKNSVVGIQSDTLGSNSLPTLTINNTIIENSSDIGLFAQGSHVEGSNNLIKNSGRYSMVLNIGGTYKFTHCTFSNFYEFDNRSTASILINNYYEDINGEVQSRALNKAEFKNCIISGSLSHEIALQNNNKSIFNYEFNHCLLKLHPDSSISNLNHTNSQKIISDYDLFEDLENENFIPKENSLAIDNAVESDVTNDILGNPRVINPDIGAFEKVY